MEKYEIFTTHIVGYTTKAYKVGDLIRSIGFGSLDKRVWKVDDENKRYHVDEVPE